MKIKITADSTCDLSRELVEKYDIRVVPLHIIKAEESFADGVEISPQEIFNYVSQTGDMC